MSADMDFIPAEAFLPGEFLREELEERGWTQADLSEILGKPAATVSQIILGKREIDAAIARTLAEAFGTSPQYWLNLELSYRLYLDSQKRSDGAVARRAKLYEKAPVKDMVKRGWISGSSSIDVLEKNVCDFLGVGTLDDSSPSLAHAVRKSSTYVSETPALRAWVARARQVATATPVTGNYSRGSVGQALIELQRLLPAAAEVRQAARILASYGIRLVVVETINKAKVDGVTLWLDDDSPVVAISLRYDRIDWFWFTLLHELEHVARGEGKNEPIIDDLDAKELPANEREVNARAQANLIPPDELDDFVARTAPLYSRVKVENFARSLKVHPGIVVGQLHRRQELDWSHFRALLVKVREVVTDNTVTDGWGHAPLAL